MNLWAESDNLEIAGTPPERARKPGASHANTNTNVILPALRSWLLADYVAPYCRSLAATRIFHRCFWIDALGGVRAASKKAGASQGRDDENGSGREGRSGRDELRPYIFDDVGKAEQSNHNPSSRFEKAAKKARSETLPPALQAVAALSVELAHESKPITLQGIALDTTRSVGTRFIASAPPSTSTSPGDTFALPKESGVINAGWREAAPVLLPAIEQMATIFLLNPLAMSRSGASAKGEVPFLTAEELAPLVQRTAPTEVCLLLMHSQIESVFLPALRSQTGAAAFTTLLRSDRWKAPLMKLLTKEGDTKLESAIDLWQACLKPHFSFVQRMAFPLLIGPAAVEDAPCALLFATRRQDSLVCMNDAVRNYRRYIEQESRRGILNEAWFAAQQAERDAQALQQLSEDILREGRARSPRRWPDLRQQLLLERFGQWTLREYDEMMCRLLQVDEVRCAWRQANAAGEPGRAPGNEDILQWQWKKRHY